MSERRTCSFTSLAESLFDQLLRGMADAEAGDGGLLAQFLELLVELLGDPLRGISTETFLAPGPASSTRIGYWNSSSSVLDPRSPPFRSQP